jgi:uncharacterized membrane protein
MYQHFLETTSRQRLSYSVGIGVGVFVLPIPLAWQTASLLAWCAGTAVYLTLAWLLALGFDAERTRQRAQAQDQAAWVIFLVLFFSVFASIVAIALMLQHVSALSLVQRYAHLGLSMLALGASWLMMQTLYAFRYAHLYYGWVPTQQDASKRLHHAGLVFPGKQAPDYFDFFYYASVIGMTSQVSDVQVISRSMRHLTLVHSLSAFAFNMLVLALSINVMAGAI